MALKKDKQKVLGETFDDERVKGFLNIEPRDGIDTDFLRLERAYRSMNAENFASFVGFFVEAGHNLDACNPQGQNMRDIVSKHAESKAYLDALRQAGAS